RRRPALSTRSPRLNRGPSASAFMCPSISIVDDVSPTGSTLRHTGNERAEPLDQRRELVHLPIATGPRAARRITASSSPAPTLKRRAAAFAAFGGRKRTCGFWAKIGGSRAL